jgi:hypothetical protein
MLLSEDTSKAALIGLAGSLLESAEKLGPLAGRKPDPMDAMWMALASQVITRLSPLVEGHPSVFRSTELDADEFRRARGRLVELIDLAAS